MATRSTSCSRDNRQIELGSTASKSVMSAGKLTLVLLLACALAPDQSRGDAGIRADLPRATTVEKSNPLNQAGHQPTKRAENPQYDPSRLLWGDVHFFREWHIQHNVLTNEYRLLGPDEKPIVSGTFEVCHDRLTKIRHDRNLPPMKGEAVVLVHGLVRSFSRMLMARQHLEKAGYENVFVFDYASTEVDIPTAAESLHRAIQSLEGIEKVHLVAHSMGGIVVRQYLAKHPEPRIGRLVMLGTPNQGAELSDRFGNNPVFRFVFGPAAEQLATPHADAPPQADLKNSSEPAKPEFLKELPAPKCEFAVIAGCRGTDMGYNPLIPGDDDGIVGLASTPLVGAKDSMTVHCHHSRLTRDPAVLECVTRFLKEGKLRKEGPPQPILNLAAPPATEDISLSRLKQQWKRLEADLAREVRLQALDVLSGPRESAVAPAEKSPGRLRRFARRIQSFNITLSIGDAPPQPSTPAN